MGCNRDKSFVTGNVVMYVCALFSSSENKTAQILEMSSELKALFSYDEEITHKQLYRISDTLYKHKEQIDSFLYKRITDMFNLEDKLVIFDISNTYFSQRDGFPESRKSSSKLAKYGRSKEVNAHWLSLPVL